MLRRIVSIILCLFMVASSVIPQNNKVVYAYDSDASGLNVESNADEVLNYKTTSDDDFDISNLEIDSEVISKRTSDSKTFRKVDGTYVMAIYNSVIHYEQDGELKDIDNSLIYDESTNEYANTANSFSIKFPKEIDENKKFKLNYNDYQISWTVTGIDKSDINYYDNTKASNNLKDLTNISQQLVYDNVQNNVNLEYILNGNEIKENILLEKYIEDFTMSFTYTLKNLILVEDANGNFVFMNEENEIIFLLNNMVMFDSEGAESSDIGLVVNQIKKDEYQIEINPNDEFLKNANYPVTIDPTVTYYGDDNLIRDKYVFGSSSNDLSYIKVGYSNTYAYRSYLEFDISQIPNDVKINYAHLYLKTYTGRNYCINDCTIVAKEVLATVDYDDINAEGLNITSSREIDFANVLYSDGDTGTYMFDITYNMQRWTNSSTPYRTIELRSQNEGEYGYIWFNSENYSSTLGPVVEIGYVNTFGIKDYWTYNSQDVGIVGTGYVSDYTGYLTFIRTDFSFATDKQSLGVSFAYNNAQKDNNIGYGDGWNVSYNTRIDYDDDLELYYTTDYTGNIVYYYPTSCPSKYVSGYPYTDTCYVSEDGSGKILNKRTIYGSLIGFYIYDGDNRFYFNNSGYLLSIKEIDYSLYITISRDSTYPDQINYVKDSSNNYLRFYYSSGRLSYILLRTAKIESEGTSTDYLEKVVYTYESGTDDISQVKYYSDYDQDNDTNIDATANYDYDYYDRLQYAYVTNGEKIEYTYINTINDKVMTIESYFNTTKFLEVNYDYGFRETTITDHTGSFVIYKFDDYGHTTNIIDKNTNTVYYNYIDIFNDESTYVSGEYNYNRNNELIYQSVPQKLTYNPVENYSFEIGTYAGWSLSSTISAFRSSYECVGNYSLATTDFTHSGGFAYQDVVLDEGVYTFRASIRNDSSSSTGAYIYALGVSSDEVIDDGTWYYVSVPIYISQDETTVRLYLYNETGGTIRFDNVSIVDGINDTRVNIVENSSFENNGTSGWSISDPGYTTYYSINDGDNDINETFEWILSEHAVGIEGSATDIRNISTTIEKNYFDQYSNEGVFYIGGWANTYSSPLVGNTNYDGDKVFRITVEFVDSNGDVIDEEDTNYITFNQCIFSWQYIYGEVNAPDYSYYGVKISYEYQGLGEVIFDGLSVFFESSEKTYNYDSQGRLTDIFWSDGKEHYFHYDSDEDIYPSYVEDENGNITYIEANNGKITYIEVNNIKSTPTYNSYGQVTKTEVYGLDIYEDEVKYFENSTTYMWNNQYVASTTDEFGNTTDYMTDELTGLLEYIENAKGIETQYEYYDNGMLYQVYIGESLTDSTPYVKYTYDSLDRLIEIELDTNYVYQLHYDSLGRMDYVQINDQTIMSYDYLVDVYETGVVSEQTYGNGDKISFMYNDDNQIEYIKFTGCLESEITKFHYQYDSLGRVSVYEDLINNIVEYYEYDSNGDLYKITFENDDEIIYSYDTQGNLSKIEYNLESINSETNYDYQTGTNYDFYDYTSYTNGNSTISKDYIYESYGLRRLDYIMFYNGTTNFMDMEISYVTNTGRINEVVYNFVSPYYDDISFIYTYDSLGNITSEEYQEDGVAITKNYYYYNDFNQLEKESMRDYQYSTSSTYAATNYSKYYYYDVNGNLTDIREYGYGVSDTVNPTIPSYFLSNIGSYTAVMFYNGSNDYMDIYSLAIGQSPSLSFTYYDMWDTHHDFPLTGMTTTMTYSNLNTSVAGYYYRTYHAAYGNYDLTFRIVFKVGNPVGGFRTAEKHVSYTYDNDWLDQLESYTVDIDGVSKTSTITYDNSGNPEEISNFYYDDVKYHHAILSWDGRELVNIVIYNDAQGLDIIAEISYTYNDQGIRIQKIVDDEYSTTKHEYKMTGVLVIAEIVSQYNDSTHEWDLSYKIAYNFDYDGSPIGFTYFVGSSKTDYIYIKNQLGDITHITLTSGYVVVQYEYDSYGNIINIDGSSQVGQYNIYRYRGYKYDKEISLYYLNSRYYNPEIGRFISADGYMGQTKDVLSANMYSYCENNPIMFSDPNGYSIKWSTILTVVAVVAVVVAVAAVVVATAGAAAGPAAALAMSMGSAGTFVLGGASVIVPTFAVYAAGVAITAGLLALTAEQAETQTRNNNNGKTYLIYGLYNNATNQFDYIGRTTEKNRANREAAHKQNPNRAALEFKVIASGLTYAEARGLEQLLMIGAHTINAANKSNNLINGISPVNKNLNIYMDAGWHWIENNAWELYYDIKEAFGG
ncbi:MAG: RHS repeat-associated core domain-containing protein [Tenericutes bacterium]|nr:RHS repeat-associated core domain-containing protein [Mycoplasmatota bacterium]